MFFDRVSALATIEGIEKLAQLKGQWDCIAGIACRATKDGVRLQDVVALEDIQHSLVKFRKV
jgi:hypothetical protein